jgi:hypothetical protein
MEKHFIQHFSRKSEGKGHLGDLGVDGKIILKCILNKFIGRGLDSTDTG